MRPVESVGDLVSSVLAAQWRGQGGLNVFVVREDGRMDGQFISIDAELGEAYLADESSGVDRTGAIAELLLGPDGLAAQVDAGVVLLGD